jgi:hypothetical protein
VGGHNLPRDAESALHCAKLHKSFLSGMKFHLFMDALRKALNRDNGFAIRALGRIDARNHRLTIHKDSTRATLSLFTTDFGARQAKSLAQKGRERFARFCIERMLDAVDNKRDLIIHSCFP